MEILIINKNKTIFNWDSKKSNEDIELVVTKVNENKYIKKIAIATLAYSMFKEKIVLAAASGPNSLDPLGMKLLRLIRGWAKYIILLICVVEIARSGIKGENKTLSIIIKYLIVYVSLFLVPELFNAVEDAFPN